MVYTTDTTDTTDNIPFKMYLIKRHKPPDITFLVISVIFSLLLSEVRTDTVFKDTVVISKRTLSLSDSPYLVQKDVVVESEGHLVIESGVTMKFSPGVGITVRGVLTADGESDNKIVFTSAGDAFKQENRTIRLVDGPTVQQGIIQARIRANFIQIPPLINHEGTP